MVYLFDELLYWMLYYLIVVVSIRVSMCRVNPILKPLADIVKVLHFRQILTYLPII